MLTNSLLTVQFTFIFRSVQFGAHGVSFRIVLSHVVVESDSELEYVQTEYLE